MQTDLDQLLELVEPFLQGLAGEATGPAALVILAVAAALGFYRTEKVSLSSIPRWAFRLFVPSANYIRVKGWKTLGPDPMVQVGADVHTVRRALIRHHFAPNWILSMYYRDDEYGDEALNMRRIDEYNGDYEYRTAQDHVRGFVAESVDGRPITMLVPHREPDALSLPGAHWFNNWLEEKPAADAVCEALEEEDVPFKRLR